ncbi:MAG: hypothetical protein NWF04_05165 [Candidatus Bathyarchaeota archaeon]|nr:hypothetical protein [Candidatus Bathyarchaeota archaeon]
MSLTVNDAQYLSWKTFKKFQTKQGSSQKASETAAELLSKVQKIAQKIAAAEQAGTKADKEELGQLLAGALHLMFILSEHHGVNVEDKFMQAIDEYVMGFVQ